MRLPFIRFLPFWLFLLLYKFGGALHYSLLAPLGEPLLPLWAVGALMGGGSLVQLLLDVPVGHLMDRFGYLRFLRITTLIFAVAGVVLFLFPLTPWMFVTTVVLSTFGWLFYSPGVNAYILSHAPKEHAGAFISLRDTFASLGVVAGTAILTYILAQTTSVMGAVIAGLMFMAWLALLWSPRDHVSVHAEKKIPTHHWHIRRHPLGHMLRALRTLNPASTMLLVLSFSAATFYGIVWFIVPLTVAHELGNNMLGLGLGVFDFSVVVMGYILGNIADRGNRRSMVFFGLLLFALSGSVLGFNFNWLFLIFGFLATTGDEMAGISLWSWLHALDHDHANDGLIAGVITLFEDLGWAVGPFLAGILYTAIGAQWSIAAGGALIFCAWLAYQILIQWHKPVRLYNIPHRPHRRRHKS